MALVRSVLPVELLHVGLLPVDQQPPVPKLKRALSPGPRPVASLVRVELLHADQQPPVLKIKRASSISGRRC